MYILYVFEGNCDENIGDISGNNSASIFVKNSRFPKVLKRPRGISAIFRMDVWPA